MQRLLILNADDFGRSREVNAAVARALELGILTSASLMITGDAVDEAVEIARAHPQLAVGLHVAVTAARPVLPDDRVRHLIDTAGQLRHAPARQALRLTVSRAARAELADELRAQFDRFAATGLPLAHVDGHMHMHMHPAVFDLVVPLAVAHGAHGIRVPADDLRLALRHDPRRPLIKLGWAAAFSLLARRARRRLVGQPLRIAERVYGLMQSGAMDEDYLVKVIGSLSSASAEIYFHPSTRRLDEPLGPNPIDLATLLSPRLREAIASRDIGLVSYRTLAGGR